ncbi:glycosyltransferase [Psychrobacillus vulpis]|uniref:Glycosyltransferase family 4 protein n=1 Tax=Psychrobacillus vulpis TaxID=2325572 RepID=A0A544TUV7_9BACI|nr:glycosyltransferase [Psychrobacillus vulpis]TQR21227.1 glycosyltransferase family 4 protein [Psychrobacillus vulpis]
MKVLIVPSWYPNELNEIAGVFFKEQAIALKNQQLEVIVAYPEIWDLCDRKKIQSKSGFYHSVEKGIETYRYRMYNHIPLFRGYSYIPLFGEILKNNYSKSLTKIVEKIILEKGLPDIIHAHSILWGGWAAVQIARKYGIPLVITEHSTLYSRKKIRDWQVPYIKESLNIANKIIVVGPGLQKELQQYTDKEIIIVPNIVDTQNFKPTSHKEKNTKKFRFFTLGFLTYKKGMDVLLKAFSLAFNNDPYVELIIGGDGEERLNLEKIARDLNIYEKVVFLGELTRDEVVVQMQDCDSFVLSSRDETFGVVYIEALACGKPIIATKSGGPDFIVNKKNGFLVEVDDIRGLAFSMVNMKKNRNNFKEKEIIMDCHERFAGESVSKQLIEIYSTVKNKKY